MSDFTITPGQAKALSEAQDRFQVKDSGERKEFASGMVRDVTEGKIDYLLVLDGPMFKRQAEHLTKGAVKYAKRNWMQAAGQEELDRFIESATRHFFQWLDGATDEDHAAAVFFNINGAEYVRERMPKVRLSDLYEEAVERNRITPGNPDEWVDVIPPETYPTEEELQAYEQPVLTDGDWLLT